VTLNAAVTEAIDQASAKLNALSNKLLELVPDIGENTDALFALDDARKGIAKSQHDLRRVQTRLAEKHTLDRPGSTV